MKKVLFILSGNLSTTPRALKSILSISEHYDCHILAVNRLDKWFAQDQALIQKHQLKVTFLHLGRKPFTQWFLATLIVKGSQLFYNFFKNNLWVNANASNKSSALLWQYLRRNRSANYSLILGHGAGALFPAWWLAGQLDIPFILDVEDYHPGEYISSDAVNEKQRREFLMKKLLPQTAVLTTASPLIGKYTLDLIGGHSAHQVVLNSFPRSEFISPKQERLGPLSLVWFSQKISFGRGLEQLFEALKMMDDSCNPNNSAISITLIGDLDLSFEEEVISPFQKSLVGGCLTVLTPMAQKDLHASLVNYDVGLALEIGKDLNNEIAISNKIMAYAQAGLFILATDTLAQTQFISENPEMGSCTGQNPKALKESLMQLQENVEMIRAGKSNRFESARTFAWEHESEKLLYLLKTANL